MGGKCLQKDRLAAPGGSLGMLGGFPCPPVQGQPTVTMLTSILGQGALVTISSGESGVQSPGTAGCG